MEDQTKSDGDPAFEPTDKIESFLIGFISFIGHFLRTLRDLAFSQTKFSHAIISHESDRKYAKPVTFITMMSFLAIRIFRFGLLTLLLAVGTLSCSPETRTKTVFPSLLDELQIPTFNEIILYGIPTLIVVLLVSKLLKFVLLKGSDKSRRTLVSITYYSVGFQYMAYLALFLLISLLAYLQPPEYFLYIIYVALPLFLLWGVFVFYRLVSKAISINDLRISRPGLKQAWLVFWSFVLMAVTTLSGAEMAYSLAKMEIKEYEPKSILSMGLIGSDQIGTEGFSVDVVVRNNSTEEVSLISKQVVAYGELRYEGEVTRYCSGLAPVIILLPNQVCWLTISFEGPGAEYAHAALFYSMDDLISFDAISPAGENQTISAYIRSGGEKLKLSEIE